MLVGDRLKQIREAKSFSQGDIEKKTGLLRCYLSRCECNHTTPSVETLEKWTRALGIDLWQLFADDKTAKKNGIKALPVTAVNDDDPHISRLKALMPRIPERDRRSVVKFAASLARAK